MKPLVSIVMSCYNAENTVAKAIESILQQTLVEFEFIVIDDKSEDRTLEILRLFEKIDPRIVLLKNDTNIGLSASLNRGINASQSKYIVRMDADDWSFKDRLQKQYSFLETNTDIDVLGGAVLAIKKGRVGRKLTLPSRHKEIIGRAFRKTMVFHPTVMVRKSVFEKFGLYDPELRWAEDTDLWLRIYDKVKFHNLQDTLIKYKMKSRLSWFIVRNNLKVKWQNLARRSLQFRYLPFVIRDTIIQTSRILIPA